MKRPSSKTIGRTVTGFGTLPFYLGGFLGPFGTMVIVPMLPELRARFEVDTAAISWGFSAYLFPMAALLLVSGTIGERFGRRLVLRISLSAYIIASLLVSFAPTLGLFLAARAMQGIGNAFITPLLIAGLADGTEPHRLGSRIGIYTSFQAAGGGLAPFVGGLAATVDWRYAFWGTAAVTAFILVFVPPGERRTGADRPPIKPLFSRRLLTLGIGAFAAAAGPIGAGILVGLKTRDILGIDAATAGLILATGNFGAMLLGPLFGQLLDRYGARLCGVFSVTSVSVLVAVLGQTETTIATVITYAAAGSMFGFVIVVFQQVGASIVPENRAGALSAILSFRFVGHAAGPLLLFPLFQRSPQAAFAVAAALGMVTVTTVVTAIPRQAANPVPAPLPIDR